MTRAFLRLLRVSRRTSKERLYSLLEAAWQVNEQSTIQLMLYLRDCRGGKGLKEVFHQFLLWLALEDKARAKQLLKIVPEYGSYEDWNRLIGTMLEKTVVRLYAQQLMTDLLRLKAGESISLAGKWAPSEHSYYDRQYQIVSKLAKEMDIRHREYRTEYLVPLRRKLQVLETALCGQAWNEIDLMNLSAYHQAHYRKSLSTHQVMVLEKFTPRYQLNLSTLEIKAHRNLILVDEVQASELILSLGRALSEKCIFPWNNTVLTVQALLGNDGPYEHGAILAAVIRLSQEQLIGPQEMPHTIQILAERPYHDFFVSSGEEKGDTLVKIAGYEYEEMGCLPPKIHYWNFSHETSAPTFEGHKSIFGYNQGLIETYCREGKVDPTLYLQTKILQAPRYQLPLR